MNSHDEWRVMVDAPRPAAEHMAVDVRLAQEEIPTLRLFLWDPPAVSLGWKQPWPDWLSRHQERGAFEVVERPTGGAMAFHGTDVSLSAVVPRDLSLPLDVLMTAVCESAVALCRTHGIEATAMVEFPRTERVPYCLTQASPYAVLIGARKVAGFAVRRFPRTWLIQGSLLVRPLPEALRTVLPAAVAQMLGARAMTLSDGTAALLRERDLAVRWAQQWPAWWKEAVSNRLGQVA